MCVCVCSDPVAVRDAKKEVIGIREMVGERERRESTR